MPDQYNFTSPAEREWFEIVNSTDIQSFITKLSKFSCRRCSLSEHNNRVVINRGNPNAHIMLVGEAPGKVEDKEGLAFVGPAGILTDKIFASVGIDTNTHMYLSNITRCRPVAKKYSGRENYTPVVEQTNNCKPYLLREIELIKPDIVIAAGKTAAITLFKLGTNSLMKHIAGRFFTSDEPSLAGVECFVLYHPAALLHNQDQGLRQTMWDHVQVLRKRIDQLGIKL